MNGALHTPEELALLETIRDELAELEPMELGLGPASALRLVALIQLALRHPSVSAELRAPAERFLDAAREYFADCQATLEIIRRGDDPREDRPAGLMPM